LTQTKKNKTKQHPGLPSRAKILDFLQNNPGPTAKRDIARAFGIKGGDKITLKALLKELERSGEYDSGRRRAPRGDGRLPETITIEVTGTDVDEGQALARPVDWDSERAPPLIRVIADRRSDANLSVGERALVRLRQTGRNEYEARIMRRIERAPEKILGVLTQGEHGLRLMPTNRRVKTEFSVSPHHVNDAKPGEIVLAEMLPGRRMGTPPARIVERLGAADAPKAASLIAIYSHDIPVEFPPAALAAAEQAQPPSLGNREDLRRVPLVTIDGEDARDFDDAVFAEPDDDTNNPGGFHLIVAIADVAYYVRPNEPLDTAARERGNSVYFPDRVVPMLPERLSNDLCSLRPKEERPCMAVHMWIDAHGKKLRHRFTRALMRSAARLTYDQAQATIDNRPDGAPSELREPVIAPLYAAYHALAHARRHRGTLELDIEERKVVLSEDGKVERIVPRPRHDSHKLIEEFMIAANVCAAETIEQRRLPCMYRVHEEPDRAKLDALRDVLDSLGFRLARGQVLTPKLFNRILDWAADQPFRHMVNDMVLRSQSMAIYSPDNRGHFGLALVRYAHFTSPIRRYSDLLVHRALITGLGLGDDGLFAAGPVDFEAAGEHISTTERRAAAAEREAIDRYVAAYLSNRVGASFTGRISGVARFGAFVTLDGLGADGLIPIRSLPQDFYHHDAARHVLRGQRTNRTFTLGDPVEVRLVEAQALRGSLTFELLEGDERPAPSKRKFDAQTPPHKRYGRPRGGKPSKRNRH
jgi:ribonuclease R